jgi:hypothetical protein
MREKIQSLTSSISYNIILCIFALVSVVFSLTDLFNALPSAMQQIDNAIYVLFILDYFVRFAVADGENGRTVREAERSDRCKINERSNLWKN